MASLDYGITFRTCALIVVVVDLRAFAPILTGWWAARVVTALTVLTRVPLVTDTPGNIGKIIDLKVVTFLLHTKTGLKGLTEKMKNIDNRLEPPRSNAYERASFGSNPGVGKVRPAEAICLAHEVVFKIQSLYRYVIRNVIALMKRWSEGPKFLQTGPWAKKLPTPGLTP